MRETLVVIGLGVMATALRSSRSRHLRKLGALVVLAASFCIFYFISGNLWIGGLGIFVWAFLPWIELLTRIRTMRLPLENRLNHQTAPNPSYFPNAPEATEAMEDEGFEFVSNCGWEWDGMQQHFRLYWHPEERAVAAVCLCEQGHVAFAFITITSHDSDDRIWRTTNYPFAPTLRCAPHVKWNHLPCRQNCFHQILEQHQSYLNDLDVDLSKLRIPDPENIEHSIESEMQQQIKHNLDKGIIRMTDDGHFKYSCRGLLFLWAQFIKDMARFC